MKIAFVHTDHISDFYKHKSSISIWYYNIAKKISSKADIILYAPRKGNQKRVEIHKNVVLYRLDRFIDPIILFFLPIFYRQLFFLKNRDKKPYFSSILYHFFYGVHLSLSMRKNKPDIIHISEQTQLIPIIKALNPSSKIVLHMHCNVLNRLDHNMVQKRINDVDLIIGPSEYIINKIKSNFNNKATVINNGVDVDLFKPIKSDQNKEEINNKKLLFVGRISPEKGIHILIKSFKKVLKQNSNLQLHIIGKRKPLAKDFLMSLIDEKSASLILPYVNAEKWYIDYLNELINNLGLKNKIIFHGSIKHDKIIPYYCSAHILINPSLSEAFGMSLIEASSCETPVIASDVGGMPEIVIDGETGLLVEANNDDALSEAILKLLFNNDLSRKMGKKGRKRIVEKFNWDLIASQLFEEYKKITYKPLSSEHLLDTQYSKIEEYDPIILSKISKSNLHSKQIKHRYE
jgi:glycosyltransferase involved in cell wall biosynthesis